MSAPASVLALRAARVGDTLHVRPALELLRRALPDARLVLVCSDYAAAAARGLPLDAVVPYPHKGRGPAAWAARARARAALAALGPFELALGLEDKPWARRLAALVGARRFAAESAWGEHVVERKAGVLVPLGLYDPARDGPPPPIRWAPTPAARDQARALLAQAPRPRVLLQAGSHATAGLLAPRRRRDPHPRWLLALGRALAARLDATLVLQSGLGGREARAAAALARALRLAGARVVHLEGLDLEGLGGALSELCAVVSANTGPAHLAAALGKPVVLLEGPSTRAARPWRAEATTAVLDRGLPCSPCGGTAHGRACAVPACLDGIPPAEVVSALRVLLRA
ncbi:MAG: glycosyltransferase family 9 protein [Planctomycetota bacterium]